MSSNQLRRLRTAYDYERVKRNSFLRLPSLTWKSTLFLFDYGIHFQLYQLLELRFEDLHMDYYFKK